MPRLRLHDPRTVARDIPGVFDSIFPQLTPGVVAHFNRRAEEADCPAVPLDLVRSSSLQQAMLFELGFAVGETLLAGNVIDWNFCLGIAIARQRRHFDAVLPDRITATDQQVAEQVGRNMASMTKTLSAQRGVPPRIGPNVPGFQWISSGQGDLSIGSSLIEVKCSKRSFSASDYRQLVMYWLLSFAASVETDSVEWTEGVLLNPRNGLQVQFDFGEFLHIISAGRTKVDILQLFTSLVGTRDPIQVHT
jgi:hypothetical protein